MGLVVALTAAQVVLAALAVLTPAVEVAADQALVEVEMAELV